MKYLDELEKLNLPKDGFAIFGSGPLGVRSIRETNDLDIIVKQDLWEKLEKKYEVKEQDNSVIKIGNIEIYKSWKPWFDDVDNLINEADIINEIRFVKLERVLEWKRKFNRGKDRRDIELIDNYLNKNEK